MLLSERHETVTDKMYGVNVGGDYDLGDELYLGVGHAGCMSFCDIVTMTEEFSLFINNLAKRTKMVAKLGLPSSLEERCSIKAAPNNSKKILIVLNGL